MSKTSKVAEHLTNLIDRSPKTQLEIADEVGFPRANMIAMVKSGVSKLPVARILVMAKSLEADPVEMFRLVMGEYMPELLEVADEVYQREKLSTGEAELIKRLRLHTSGKSFRMTPDVNRAVDELGKLINK